MIKPDPARLDHLWTELLGLGYRRGVRPLLFRSHRGDPEAIHDDLIRTLAALPVPVRSTLRGLLATPAHPVEVCGISFPHRVGLAAGLDKDGRAVQAWASLGFGFVELGTVTPRAQPGNERPRLFRLPASGAIINRMGFNNAGADALARRLRGAGIWRGNGSAGLPVGISIGKNRTTDLVHAVDDYREALRLVAPHADYVAVNVSSPNTPGLRRLQDAEQLRDLVSAVVGEARALTPASPLPVWVKLAPDLEDEALDELVDVCQTAGASALVATNTTLSRAGVAAADQTTAAEAGGLSGAPLTARALHVVDRVATRASIPVVGVGGIMTAKDAHAMFDAGARLVQLYTGFIYHGPALVREIAQLADFPGPASSTPTQEDR